MKILFRYDEDADVKCLINLGKGSKNSGKATAQYEELIASGVDISKEDQVKNFIRNYIQRNKINIEQSMKELKTNWDRISNEYQRRAEKIFELKLGQDITAYLTINGRFPYNIEHNFFYVPPWSNANKIIMHELWHFYTWYKFVHEREKIGAQKYNDLKESLTVLLNVECKDLLEGVPDNGYPQHKEMRELILKTWLEEKNIEKLWKQFSV